MRVPGNLRSYGQPPFSVVVVHGGPGAAGEMAALARVLAANWGVLEPLQTATSLAGQIEELRTTIETHGSLPVTLVGFSWGAWLSFLVAARHPGLVRKLVLIGSGSYDDKDLARVHETRMNRLGEVKRATVGSLNEVLVHGAPDEKDMALARLGELLSKADAYDPLAGGPEAIDCRAEIFQEVWRDAAALRKSGALLAAGKQIACPVVAIHGDYDPHPAEGVQKPLAAVLKDFRFILLKNCGHRPWIERHAKEKFYQILKEELHML
jgi:pimeloyl-ACP methyl ester carboxylesterase